MIIFLSDVVTLQEKDMEQTVRKQHYKFTLYRLDTYYHKESKGTRYWLNNEVYYENKTWVNQSNYEEVFSLQFTDESKLKTFLKNRYIKDYSRSFYTNLGVAIKNCNLHNAPDWIAIVSTATSLESITFQLKERKKKNRFPQRRRSRYHDYYASSYDWLAREIKRKKIDAFIKQINEI